MLRRLRRMRWIDFFTTTWEANIIRPSIIIRKIHTQAQTITVEVKAAAFTIHHSMDCKYIYFGGSWGRNNLRLMDIGLFTFAQNNIYIQRKVYIKYSKIYLLII